MTAPREVQFQETGRGFSERKGGEGWRSISGGGPPHIRRCRNSLSVMYVEDQRICVSSVIIITLLCATCMYSNRRWAFRQGVRKKAEDADAMA